MEIFVIGKRHAEEKKKLILMPTVWPKKVSQTHVISIDSEKHLPFATTDRNRSLGLSPK